LRSPSQPLDPGARRFMEARFGHDFSHVRVHADSEAAEASRSAGAQAYTVGPDMVFGAGQYQPGSRSGRQLIAHELAHVLQHRDGEPVVRRRILYPSPTVTPEDPIPRYLSGDDSLALTTLTVNGKEQISDRFLLEALRPKGGIEPRGAPVAPSPGSGSGSGSGSGGGSGSGARAGQGSGGGPGSGAGSGSASGGGTTTVQCGFKNYDISVSANIRLPREPADGRWGPDVIERRNIKRSGLPEKCRGKDQISVVMKGEQSTDDFYQWMKSNEQDHVNDITKASDDLLKPAHQAILAMRGTGADSNACAADLNNQLSGLSVDDVLQFTPRIARDVACRDVPGGHKFDSELKDRNDCDNLGILLKKTPPPAVRVVREGCPENRLP
jgi:hypothetical protein